ncbi:MAG: methyltransferase domain-containing protein [Acidimicrobiales bacterium]
MDDPTFAGTEFNVRYLDWFTTRELQETHRQNPKRISERMVDVTYAVKSKCFSAMIDDRFDVVIANHVVEHIPDVITWFRELAAVCTADATIFLSVPDRNYTFDYVRPEATAVDLLRAYDADLERPDYYQILEAIYYWRPVTAADVWTGEELSTKLASKRYSLRDAMSRATRLAVGFKDSHCHVFSRDTFPAVWADLEESGLVDWTLKDIADVQEGLGEFHVMFARA